MGREKREKREGSKGNEGRRRTNAPPKTIVTWEYTIYLQGNLFCVLETKYLNYQKKKKEV
jgi:hypothetical protein